jgi:hypothetical protein
MCKLAQDFVHIRLAKPVLRSDRAKLAPKSESNRTVCDVARLFPLELVMQCNAKNIAQPIIL